MSVSRGFLARDLREAFARAGVPRVCTYDTNDSSIAVNVVRLHSLDKGGGEEEGEEAQKTKGQGPGRPGLRHLWSWESTALKTDWSRDEKNKK